MQTVDHADFGLTGPNGPAAGLLSASVDALTSRPAAVPSLSARLKGVTAPLHTETDKLLGLPDSIRTRGDYIAWLTHFLGLYEPLERCLARFSEWSAFGIPLPLSTHSDCLVVDLSALGVDCTSVPRAPPSLLPDLATFARALGALYVLEGATLGGRMILRGIDERIADKIAGATSFFGGRGEAVGPMWHAFRVGLDGFGCDQPYLQEDVLFGAESAFHAILVWFAPFRASATP
jgi:heme oxygenase